MCGESAEEFCMECDKHYCNGCSSLVHQHPKRLGHTVSSLPCEADPGEQEVEESEAGGKQEQKPDLGAHLSQQGYNPITIRVLSCGYD